MADVVELVDTQPWGGCDLGRKSSSLFAGTKDSFIKSNKNELTVMWAFFMLGISSLSIS